MHACLVHQTRPGGFGRAFDVTQRLLSLLCAGNISSWKVKVGDEVAAGDQLAEVETDKATMDWESQVGRGTWESQDIPGGSQSPLQLHAVAPRPPTCCCWRRLQSRVLTVVKGAHAARSLLEKDETNLEPHDRH